MLIYHCKDLPVVAIILVIMNYLTTESSVNTGHIKENKMWVNKSK